MEGRYTPWHYLLAEVMQHLIDERFLEVSPFDKLGTLPLEADIILQRKKVDQDLAMLHPEFDFLMRHLGLYTVVEYKSPEDRLTHEDLDTVRAYAMLCKRKYELVEDASVRIAMLYSHTGKAFFDASKANGLNFRRVETGIRRCDAGHLVLLAMNLAELGKQRPAHLVNLFSSRHRKFVVADEVDPVLLGMISFVYENILTRDDMKHADVRNSPDFTLDMQEIRRRLLKKYTIDERLEGVPPEEVLKRVSTEEVLKRVSLEDRLKGLSPEELKRLRELLDAKGK